MAPIWGSDKERCRPVVVEGYAASEMPIMASVAWPPLAKAFALSRAPSPHTTPCTLGCAGDKDVELTAKSRPCGEWKRREDAFCVGVAAYPLPPQRTWSLRTKWPD